MNWSEISQEILGQGPVFLAAAAAIAAGMTMLVVSIVMQLRKTSRLPVSRPQRLSWRNPLRRRSRPAEPLAPSVPAATAGYAAQADASASVPAGDDRVAETLTLLLERLRKASQQLSDLQTAAEVGANSSASVLKEPASDVEYVFRAGV